MAEANVKLSRLCRDFCCGRIFLSVSKICIDVGTLAQAVLVTNGAGRKFAIIVALSISNGGHHRATGNRSGNTQRSGVQFFATPNRILGILVATKDLSNTKVL